MRKFQGKLHILGQRHLGHLWQMQWNLYKLTTLLRHNHKLQDCNPGAPPCNDGFAALYFPCGQSGPERRELPVHFLIATRIWCYIPSIVLVKPAWPSPRHLGGEEQRSRFLWGRKLISCQWFCIKIKLLAMRICLNNRTLWRSASEGEANFLWRKEWNSLKQRLDPKSPRWSAWIFCLTFPPCTWTAPFSMCKVSNFWIVGKILYKHFNSVVWKDLLRNRGISTLCSFLKNYNYGK